MNAQRREDEQQHGEEQEDQRHDGEDARQCRFGQCIADERRLTTRRRTGGDKAQIKEGRQTGIAEDGGERQDAKIDEGLVGKEV